MSYIWALHSADYGFSQNMSIILGNYVKAGKRFSQLRIRKVFYPYIAYNVLAYNSQLRVIIPAGSSGAFDSNVTLPSGFYDSDDMISTLTTEINGLLSATNYTASIQLDDATSKVTVTMFDSIAPIVPIAFSIKNGPLSVATLAPPISEILGFAATTPAGTINPGSLAAAVTGTGLIDVIQDRYLFIQCEEAKGRSGKIDSLNVVAKPWHDGLVQMLPIYCGFGGIHHYENDSNDLWVQLPGMLTSGIIAAALNDSDFTVSIRRHMYSIWADVDDINWSVELELR